MRRKELRMVAIMGLVMIAVAGCENGYAGPSGVSMVCPTIIPQKQLPVGWRMLPSSEMPPNDKMPWWTTNPLILEGPKTKVFDEKGQPVSASRAQATMYEKDGYGVMILCLTYPAQRDAVWLYEHIQNQSASIEKRFVGFHHSLPNSLILISLDNGCPDRAFFQNYYETICRPNPTSQSVFHGQ